MSEFKHNLLETTHDAAEGIEIGGVYAVGVGSIVAIFDLIGNVGYDAITHQNQLIDKVGELAVYTTALGFGATIVAACTARVTNHFMKAGE
jgi:hypothetical protein